MSSPMQFDDWLIANMDDYSNPEQAALLAWNYQQERINKMVRTINKMATEEVDKGIEDE